MLNTNVTHNSKHLYQNEFMMRKRFFVTISMADNLIIHIYHHVV